MEGIMMIVILIGIVVVMLMLFNSGEPTRPPVVHKLHSWTVDEVTGKYVCTVCSLVAGSVNTENGDY